ncbi:MAG TPA: M23 family metallopeptidase [Candidatus Limnocylindria bacterium]|nr:M23 family metallopeptidase [Candidatus Limnocylindria bacterium]
MVIGISFRTPSLRRRPQWKFHHWIAVVPTAALIVLSVGAPVATVLAAPELGALAMAVRPAAPRVVAAVQVEQVPRPFVRARGALTTVVSDDPPAVRAHVVAPGETLLSIAVDHGIAPQTLAYNNGIADTAQLRVGQSLVVPPFDAAIHIVHEGESLGEIAARFGVDADTVREANGRAFDPIDDTPGRLVLIPVADARYPGFRLTVSEAPRVLAPRVRWPTDGVITQLFRSGHTGVDIAAPHGSPIVASDAGTVTHVGWRGPGGLAVCVHHDWGLETCAYHAATVIVEVGERVAAGQQIATVGSTGMSSGAHVHWESRTNGVLVDPLTYAPSTTAIIRVGGAVGSP